MWLDNPKIQLVIEDVLHKFDATFAKSKRERKQINSFNCLFSFLFR